MQGCRSAGMQKCRGALVHMSCRSAEVQRCRGAEVQNARYDGDAEVQEQRY